MTTKISTYYRAQKKNSGKDRKPSNLKNEVYGLLLLAIGIFLLLSLVSYHPADPVFGKGNTNFYQVKNLFGIVGARVAYFLFQFTLGYPAIVFPVFLMLLGFYLLLRKPVRTLIKPAILLSFWAYLISIGLILPLVLSTGGHVADFYPSGLWGGLSAVLLVKYFGKAGAIILWLVAILIVSILTFHIRFSTFPLFIYKILSGFLSFLRELIHEVFQFIRKLFSHKTRPVVEKSNGQRHEPSPAITSSGFEKAPVLEGERQQSQAPEIVMHNESPGSATTSAQETVVPEEKTKKVEQIEELETVPGDNVSSENKELEIEEIVPEKELDYDALVRDSLSKYQFPSTELLEDTDGESKIPREELMANARHLEQTLEKFNVKAYVRRVVEGPVITLYAVQPAEGVKISQIVSLADDLALAMRAKGIRMIAPIPGEAAIGIEIPNKNPSIVSFKSIVRSEKFIQAEGQLILGMGKTISGEIFCADLTKMPHLLIAGATGAGKSVGINTMIASLLYRVPPSDLKFVLIDPKKLELSIYAKLKDHYLALCPELDEVVITHPQNAILILRSVVNEMEERYDKLAHLGVRDIIAYNQKVEKLRQAGERSEEYRKLPYIVVIIDELADLILTAAREVEEPITRLAQMARAVGIHLIVATQRPSVDILTGLIKANFPARIAYQVATRPDSKVILDMYGAEKLIGNGDMLFMPPGSGKPIRLQNPLITTDEVERIIKHIRKQPKFPPYKLKLVRTRTTDGPGSVKAFERDELFEKAKKIVIQHQQGSASLLQRKLKIGYARAARLIDELEEAGVVGPGQGSKAREVLISSYHDEER